jgi:uncharacterized phage infection (PIP) family protein YhgE
MYGQPFHISTAVDIRDRPSTAHIFAAVPATDDVSSARKVVALARVDLLETDFLATTGVLVNKFSSALPLRHVCTIWALATV